MKNATISFLTLFFLFLTCFNGQAQDDYNWSQVRIGGGGYITGVKVHPRNNKIVYFRTDVGGAYRWNDDKQQMEQMLNFPFAKKNYYGVAGMALHPVNNGIIYLAVDRGNTTKTSKILYSRDYGYNWEEIDVPQGVKFGANGGREGGTGIDDRDREGSPIAVNPGNMDELWVGTRENGLWVFDRTKDEPWRKISDIPNNTQEASIRSVVFHPKDPNVIFVGYAKFGIYRSSNGGTSFSLINNGQAAMKDVADISISSQGTKLYVAARNKGLYKLSNPAGSMAWKKLNVPFADLFKGYQTVTASPFNDNLVLAMPAANGGNNLARLQVSWDGGEYWDTKSNTSVTNTFEWKTLNDTGAYASQIAFDTDNSNKIYVTCWFGLWYTDEFFAPTVQWSNERAKGHEEIVTSGLFAFPENTSGNVIGVNSADYPAVVIKNPDSYENTDVRSLMDNSSQVIKGQDIVACEKYPNNFAISATNIWTPTANAPSYGALLYTTDGGKKYKRLNAYDKNWGKSLIGIAANDPSNLVVVHGNQIHYSRNKGASFQKANTPSLGNIVENNVFIAHHPVANDLVLKNTFYVYDRANGSVYRSTDGGANWNKTQNGLPTENNRFSKASLKVAPDKGGHLWFNHPTQGLFASRDLGDTWKKIDGVDKVKSMALGKAISDDAYPAIYVIGKLSGSSEEALYRSIDQGKTWSKITDRSTQFILSDPRYLAADRNEFGKVYVGLGGLGVWQGGAAQNNFEVSAISEEADPTVAELNAIKLYPVPASDLMYINFGNSEEENMSWEILDYNAQSRLKGTSNKIKMSGLTSGNYVVVIRSGTKTIRKKIVKR